MRQAPVKRQSGSSPRNYMATLASFGVLAIALMGCESSTSDATALNRPVTASTSTRFVDRDIEAPEILHREARALWDGQASLGGVWVGATGIDAPQRIIIRNPSNGKFVIGTMFPQANTLDPSTLLISADAAEALAMPSNLPVMLSFTALRREEGPQAAPETPILDTAEPLITNQPIVTQVATAPEALPTTATPAIDPVKPPAKPMAKATPKSGTQTIQIGIFSIEENAKRAEATLSNAGFTPDLRQNAIKGKEYWSVTIRTDATNLSKVKAAGFKDAYVLK